MSRGVNKIKNVFLAFVFVFHLNGVALDGNAAFLLQIHIIKHLSLRNLDGVGVLQKTVGKCTLTVVDVGNDAEVSYMLH